MTRTCTAKWNGHRGECLGKMLKAFRTRGLLVSEMPEEGVHGRRLS